jgi:putative ABC transport system permease protein
MLDQNERIMLTNFFKTTIRTLWKNKTYSFLNIFGLAIGIACAGLIFLWVEDEMNYDSSYAKKDLLYNIRENQTYDGSVRTFNSTPGPMAAAIKVEVPGIVNAGRLNRTQILFSVGEKSIYERGCYADSALFSIFSMEFVQGSIKNAFKDLNSIVISEKMAGHLFGNEKQVIGKTVKFDNKENYLITGVVKDVPANSTLQNDWYVPFEIYLKQRPNLLRWGNNSTNTYVEVVPGANIAAINKQLDDFLIKKDQKASARPFLFAMNDWRLRDRFESGKQVGGRIEYVRMFTIIAWIILLIACINFMNLSTARSEKRAKEVGVRKVMGAGKKILIFQFIGEALCMATLAVIAGLAIIAFSLPFFNTLVEKQLTIGLGNPLHLASLVALALLCGLVAGSYPALYLSSFNPAQVLKSLKQKAGSAALIRKGLVVTQFTVSIVMIISTVIIFQQIKHVKNRQLGYNKDNLISVDARGDIINKFPVIRQDLLRTGVIEETGLNSFNTMFIGNNSSGYDWQGKDKSKDILVSNRNITPGLIETLGLRFKEGKNFDGNQLIDTTHIVITEALAKMMGTGSAIGKKIYDGTHYFDVIGVVNDFVYGDMYGQSDPVIFFHYPQSAKYIYVRMKPNADPKQVLAKLEGVLKNHNPAYPFEYTFVDDQFNQQFKSEMLVSTLSRVFAILTIIISCLGLFGLAAYTAERRTKEIGIRKVLGASVSGITRLLSKDFLQLVFISTLIAYPLAWWAMNKWLQGYAYRINISWWVFIVAGIGAMVIALITISFQSVKAALMNPVKSLRTE